MTFLVNLHYQEDENSLPRDKWVDVEADSALAALVAQMRAECGNSFRPQVGYVSEGARRYPNGTPMVVQRFAIQWECPHAKSPQWPTS